MLAKIEDLRKGDTVIISIGSRLSEAKLLRQPQLAKLGKKTNWNGTPRWMSILCAIREETESYTSISGYKWSKTIPVVASGKDYNREKRINFNSRDCWIIKRES